MRHGLSSAFRRIDARLICSVLMTPDEERGSRVQQPIAYDQESPHVIVPPICIYDSAVFGLTSTLRGPLALGGATHDHGTSRFLITRTSANQRTFALFFAAGFFGVSYA